MRPQPHPNHAARGPLQRQQKGATTQPSRPLSFSGASLEEKNLKTGQEQSARENSRNLAKKSPTSTLHLWDLPLPSPFLPPSIHSLPLLPSRVVYKNRLCDPVDPKSHRQGDDDMRVNIPVTPEVTGMRKTAETRLTGQTQTPPPTGRL